jgi:hypothetical protein
MKRTVTILLMAAALPLAAQTTQPARRTTAANDPADVVLDIPRVHVESVVLDVRDLHAHVSLDARVGNLVKLIAGADAGIDKVRLEINGVDAEVYLVVRLDKVADMVERTLATIDKNPEMISRVLTTVDRTVQTVGSVANTALQPGGVLTQTVNTLGQTVVRTVDTAGNLVEKTTDTAGKLVGEKNLGRVLDLPVVNETTNAAGQVVRQLRDTTGAIIEVTLDSAGKIVSSKVVKR